MHEKPRNGTKHVGQKEGLERRVKAVVDLVYALNDKRRTRQLVQVMEAELALLLLLVVELLLLLLLTFGQVSVVALSFELAPVVLEVLLLFLLVIR